MRWVLWEVRGQSVGMETGKRRHPWANQLQGCSCMCELQGCVVGANGR